jgi:hypothetical protein
VFFAALRELLFFFFANFAALRERSFFFFAALDELFFASHETGLLI